MFDSICFFLKNINGQNKQMNSDGVVDIVFIEMVALHTNIINRHTDYVFESKILFI